MAAAGPVWSYFSGALSVPVQVTFLPSIVQVTVTLVGEPGGGVITTGAGSDMATELDAADSAASVAPAFLAEANTIAQ